MKKTDHPLLKDKDTIIEVSNRTGLPYNVIFQVIKSYQEIIKECIFNGVDIKIGDLGRFLWKNIPPKYNKIYFNPQTREKMQPVNKPGFRVPSFAPTKKWKTELKEKTEFWEKGKEKESE